MKRGQVVRVTSGLLPEGGQYVLWRKDDGSLAVQSEGAKTRGLDNDLRIQPDGTCYWNGVLLPPLDDKSRTPYIVSEKFVRAALHQLEVLKES
jgi:hypothetical protein